MTVLIPSGAHAAMAAQDVFSKDDHRWVAIGRDERRPDHIIDTLEYVVLKGDHAALLDPGGQETFPAVFTAVTSVVPVAGIDFVFASHQDPDVASSLPLWLGFKPQLKCHISWVWTGFMPHFGGEKDTFVAIPDEGSKVSLNGLELEFLPAHYMHSSGNFNVWDKVAKVLFSGDVGAAMFAGGQAPPPLVVTDFDAHLERMRGFHQRWLPSNEAKNAWVDRVSALGVEQLCPQHGSIIRGADVPRFLEWLRALEVGVAIKHNRG